MTSSPCPRITASPGAAWTDLKFAVYTPGSRVPAPDAVAHLHGGPGGGIVDSVALTSVFFERLRARRDIVAFDQPGVDALGAETRCVETAAKIVAEMALAVSGAALTPDACDALTAACLAELAAKDTDIARINTFRNAQDVLAVVRALGFPACDVQGISHGTKFAPEGMRSAPEGLRAVMPDSVAPPNEPIHDKLITPHAGAIAAIFAHCAADPACSSAYPDLQDRFWPVPEKMQETALQSATGPVTGFDVVTLIDARNNWQGPRGSRPTTPGSNRC